MQNEEEVQKVQFQTEESSHGLLPLQAGMVQEVFLKPDMAMERPTLLPVLCWMSKS